MELHENYQRLSAPLWVQLEMTERCNNRCVFCYNELTSEHGRELSTAEFLTILRELSELGVELCNFNGGEPMLRPDFFELAAAAYDLKMSMHLNTNGTLVTAENAKSIKRYFPRVCTSVLGGSAEVHDRLTARSGAYDEVIRGIKYLVAEGVAVEINTCLLATNVGEIFSIAQLAHELRATAVCLTRYVITGPGQEQYLVRGPLLQEMMIQIRRIQKELPELKIISVPCPIPYCEPAKEYVDIAMNYSIACKIGYGLARISADGLVYPCCLSSDCIGDLRKQSFSEIWQSPRWGKYVRFEYLGPRCGNCNSFNECRGGCALYEEGLRKWANLEQRGEGGC